MLKYGNLQKTKIYNSFKSCKMRFYCTYSEQLNTMMKSCCKIFVSSAQRDYESPWIVKSQEKCYGSGFVISLEKDNQSKLHILTNAHVVKDNTSILVRNSFFSKKFEAKVECYGAECDLALLSINSDSFWKGMQALEISEKLPFLQSKVVAYGFPKGGDNLSVTTGVVSRITTDSYVDLDTPNLPMVQVSSPINSGNSGGPVVEESTGNVLGVAFSSLMRSSNIAYCVPGLIVKRFLDDYSQKGKSKFVQLGVYSETLENHAAREYYKISEDYSSGIIVRKIHPFSPLKDVLIPGDVLCSIDGMEIASDGTIELRPNERISVLFLLSKKSVNDKITITYIRGGQKITKHDIVLTELPRLIPRLSVDVVPSYFVVGGIVFVPVSVPLFEEWFDDKWKSKVRLELLQMYYNDQPTSQDDQIITISHILSSNINHGYDNFAHQVLDSVNDIKISNMKQLATVVDQILSNPDEKFIRFKLRYNGSEIVMLTSQLKEEQKSILKTHSIPNDRTS
eukprot:TRINITY_DN2672_c0_g1_i1.p1 TRINITY_DN2672_c0_g1~~TRINITY_DN2672_c0_g1_i1.p1  ORF type:complete len:509 (-),score=124.22 TRINITY_DN2672_c0_g1_i1:465-1991(-)